jgi:hypothetical protein
MADIIRRLLTAEVAKSDMCLLNDCSSNAVVPCGYVRETEDFLSPSILGVDEVSSSRECGIFSYSRYNLGEQQIVAVPFTNLVKKVFRFLDELG